MTSPVLEAMVVQEILDDVALILHKDQDDWNASRKKYLTATDMAGVLGLSPWAKPADIILKKRGLLPDVEMNDAMEWGNRLEGVVADKYGEMERLPVVSLPPSSHLVSNAFPWLAGTPDRFVLSGGKEGSIYGLEIKTAGFADGWGEGLSWIYGSEIPPVMWSNRGDIPDHYYIQVQTYLTLLPSIKRWDLCVLIGGREVRVYRFQRDEAMIETILHVGYEFYRDYIETPTNPIPHELVADAPEAAKVLYPVSTSGKTLEVNSDRGFIDTVKAYQTVNKVIKVSEETKSALRGEIVAKMRDAEKAIFDGGSVSYKTGKGSTEIDQQKRFDILWKHLYNTLPEKDFKTIEQFMQDPANQDRYCYEKPGIRRLVVTVKDTKPALSEAEAIDASENV